MKKLILLVCLLAVCGGGRGFAAGGFTGGEYYEDGYANAWMGLRFRTTDEFVKEFPTRAFCPAFDMQGKTLDTRFAKGQLPCATGISYSFRNNKGWVELYVGNLEMDFPEMGPIADARDYLVRAMEACAAMVPDETEKYVSAPYATRLGGRDFMAVDFARPGLALRYYAAQIDNYLVVAEMAASGYRQDLSAPPQMFEIFESCFSEYD